MLTETIQGLEAVRQSRNHHNRPVGRRGYTEGEPGRGGGEEVVRNEEGMLSPAEDEEEDEVRGRRDDEERVEKECKRKVLGVLRELSVFHVDRVTAWRKTLGECACMRNKPPAEGSDQQHPSTAGMGQPQSEVMPCLDTFCNTIQSVGEEIENIVDKLSTILTRLDAEILQLSAEVASTVDTALQETRDPETSEPPEDHPYTYEHFESDCKVSESHTVLPPDTEQPSDSVFSKSDCNDMEEGGKELEVKGQVNDNKDFVSLESQKVLLEERGKDTEVVNNKDDKETKSDWVTVGTGELEDSQPPAPDTWFIRASTHVAEVLRCEVADAFSCLMVTGSEELVSRVIRVKVQDGANLHFPVTVAVPFCARYRSNYRDVAVKIVDEERRASYVTPVTTEGAYGGQRGSFAEVRVYSLGLFAVVSCLKRENYTVPRRGLSLKLPMDPRVVLSYLPGSFSAPVMAQTMIQPIDAVLLAAIRSRSDAYHSVVSTSPLLYLVHPTSQSLRRPLSVTLPCPPNPEKRRVTWGQGDAAEHHYISSVIASQPWDQPASCRRRILGASKEASTELLIALGSRDKQWSVLEKVTVRNQQNGLVSFELTESFDRVLVLRLLSPPPLCPFTSLVEELEESVCCHMVTVVLQRRSDQPHAILVAALPSRDLSWEQNKLRAQGYSGLLETSSEICMCEGDQLLLRFSGNITSTGTQKNQSDERITFHTQRKNQLLVCLTEIDPFGNHSSPHYKGTAMFYKVARGHLEWRSDKPALKDPKLLGEPVCKLSLTLPKKMRNINRPIAARLKVCEEADSLSDSLLLWLSGELSEEEVALLVLSLRLRRSAAQLVKLRAGNSPSTQAFHVLTMWRRGLPAAPHQPKASQLAHCLAKSGRPDLARELMLRQAAATEQGSPK
ncbi:death domain-containing protein 1 [Mastacembelus armatus]|uniref:death domain-containing protein 1 n=1 Tax=Mastacembelus armatus TaxID=205130 RepID=UPI000E457230|nr:death domain-containing protein 1 [Mastacembelus armatus]